MSALIQESVEYAANTNPLRYGSVQDALADAYAHGRAAKPREEEIRAVVRYLEDSAGDFGLRETSPPTAPNHGEGMLETARKAAYAPDALAGAKRPRKD